MIGAIVLTNAATVGVVGVVVNVNCATKASTLASVIGGGKIPKYAGYAAEK